LHQEALIGGERSDPATIAISGGGEDKITAGGASMWMRGAKVVVGASLASGSRMWSVVARTRSQQRSGRAEAADDVVGGCLRGTSRVGGSSTMAVAAFVF